MMATADARPDSAVAFGEVILVDPSLFTAPYDVRLSDGLEAAGVSPIWATRALRQNEEDDFGEDRPVYRFFYSRSDGPRRRHGQAARWTKGAEHLLGLVQLVRLVRRRRPVAVHFQWALVPQADRVAMKAIRRTCPVIVTVHDVELFNGKNVGAAQRVGLKRMLTAADRLIVHTEAGRRTLTGDGFDPARISVLPHGLLAEKRALSVKSNDAKRWTIVQFGKIQAYKGVDLLVEALGRLTADARSQLRVIIAGEPMIDVVPLHARASQLGLDEVLDLRFRYQSNADIAALIEEADCFVFPYRAIEASGVFLFVAGAGKWIIASDLGAFAELVGNTGECGQLVPPGDIDALAGALAGSIDRRPQRELSDTIPDWVSIGRQTVEVYQIAAERWRAERMHR